MTTRWTQEQECSYYMVGIEEYGFVKPSGNEYKACVCMFGIGDVIYEMYYDTIDEAKKCVEDSFSKFLNRTGLKL